MNPADIFLQYMSLDYPLTEADRAKVELMTTTYSRQQEKMILQEMREFTVPELTKTERF